MEYTEESVEYSTDNTIKVKEEVKEETEDPLLVTVQPGN